jgi:hypothetical protein
MRVFISWSGEDSKTLAEFMNTWLPGVIQEVEPWISTHDIDIGEKWQESLTASLADPTAMGLLIVTKTNFKQPWLLFEAGAFQSVVINKKELLKFIFDVAKKCSKRLSEDQVKITFEKWWPDFEQCYKSIDFATTIGEKDDKPSMKIENVLEDIMTYLRRIEQTIRLPVTTKNVLEGYLESPSQGLGRLLASLPTDEVSKIAASQGLGHVFAGLSADEVSRVAAARTENVVKLARALAQKKVAGGMVDPKSISHGDNKPGDQEAPDRADRE